MRRKCHIVGPNRRLGRHGVSLSILSADLGGEEEKAGRQEVEDETEDIDGGEVDGGANGGAAAEVEDRLRVEGDGPRESAEMWGSVERPERRERRGWGERH